MRALATLFAVLFISAGGFAQADTGIVLSNLPRGTIVDYTTGVIAPTVLTIQYDNDLFHGIDRYYTQGIILKLSHRALRKSPVARILISPASFSTLENELALEQDVFTPRSIRTDTIVTGERPYCASFFITESRSSIKNKLVLRSSLRLGFLGPAALGKEEQTAIHTALNNLLPKGWENQLGNDLILNYDVEARLSLFYRRYFRIEGSSAIQAGTLYDNLQAGCLVRCGLMPGIHHKLTAYIALQGGARAVAFNATLQGGILNHNNVHTLSFNEVNHFLPEAGADLVLGYGKVELAFINRWNGAEYHEGVDHGWGGLKLRIIL